VTPLPCPGSSRNKEVTPTSAVTHRLASRTEWLAVREILRAVLDRYGSRYSFSRLATAIERNHASAIDHLEILDESFVLSVLYASDFNKKAAAFSRNAERNGFQEKCL